VPFTIELIVIHGVTFSAPFHEGLYSWLDCVIDAAISELKNQHVYNIYTYF
jgi:hypothetical protein